MKKYRGTVYVTVDIPFDEAWNDLDYDEQKEIVQINIDMVDTDALITELEYRGYKVEQDED